MGTVMRLKHYILVGRTPIAVNLWTWGEACAKRKDPDPWRVARDQINEKCFVSTVFLGLDHNYAQTGDPILFETLVFGGPMDGEMYRYCTYAEAEQGHDRILTQARIACAQVDAIANNAGAKVNQ